MKKHQPKALKLLLATAAKQSAQTHECLLERDCTLYPLPWEGKEEKDLTESEKWEIEQRERSGPPISRPELVGSYGKAPANKHYVKSHEWEPDKRDNADEIQFPEPISINERTDNLRDCHQAGNRQ